MTIYEAGIYEARFNFLSFHQTLLKLCLRPTEGKYTSSQSSEMNLEMKYALTKSTSFSLPWLLALPLTG